MHPAVYILGKLRITGLDEVQEVCVTHIFNSVVLIKRKLAHHSQFDVPVAVLYVENFGKDCVKIGKLKELLAWSSKSFKYVVDCVVFLQDDLLFVDLHSSLEVDAIVEETHQRLNIKLMLHLITCNARLHLCG